MKGAIKLLPAFRTFIMIYNEVISNTFHSLQIHSVPMYLASRSQGEK